MRYLLDPVFAEIDISGDSHYFASLRDYKPVLLLSLGGPARNVDFNLALLVFWPTKILFDQLPDSCRAGYAFLAIFLHLIGCPCCSEAPKRLLQSPAADKKFNSFQDSSHVKDLDVVEAHTTGKTQVTSKIFLDFFGDLNSTLGCLTGCVLDIVNMAFI